MYCPFQRHNILWYVSGRVSIRMCTLPPVSAVCVELIASLIQLRLQRTGETLNKIASNNVHY